MVDIAERVQRRRAVEERVDAPLLLLRVSHVAAQDRPGLAVEMQQAARVVVRDVRQEGVQRRPGDEQRVVLLSGSIDTGDQTKGAGASMRVDSSERSRGAPCGCRG